MLDELNEVHISDIQGRNHRENLGATAPMVGRICPPPGWNRVKVPENLGATSVTPVAPVDTSLVDLDLAVMFC